MTLCDPMDWIPQARILEWVAFPFSRGFSQPRDRTQVSHIAGGFLTSWATIETLEIPQNQVPFHTPSHLTLQWPLYSHFHASLDHAGPSLPQGLVLDSSTQKSSRRHYKWNLPQPTGWRTFLLSPLFDNKSHPEQQRVTWSHLIFTTAILLIGRQT